MNQHNSNDYLYSNLMDKIVLYQNHQKHELFLYYFLKTVLMLILIVLYIFYHLLIHSHQYLMYQNMHLYVLVHNYQLVINHDVVLKIYVQLKKEKEKNIQICVVQKMKMWIHFLKRTFRIQRMVFIILW